MTNWKEMSYRKYPFYSSHRRLVLEHDNYKRQLVPVRGILIRTLKIHNKLLPTRLMEV